MRIKSLIVVIFVAWGVRKVAPLALKLGQETFLFTSQDERLTPIQNLKSTSQLFKDTTFVGKRFLVVGGTKGIGRGIAMTLAEVTFFLHKNPRITQFSYSKHRNAAFGLKLEHLGMVIDENVSDCCQMPKLSNNFYQNQQYLPEVFNNIQILKVFQTVFVPVRRQ